MHQLGNIWQDRFGLMHAEYLSVMKIITQFVTECKGVCNCVAAVEDVVEISGRTVGNHSSMV